MALRAHGWNTVRTAVTNNIRLIRKLERLLKENGFTILEGGQLSVACAQWEPEDCTAAKIDDLQVRIASEIVASGKAWFSTVRHDGKTWLRFNLLNIYTKESHIDFLAKLVTKTARQLASPGSDSAFKTTALGPPGNSG
jgi:glutamate/tyrosine decarboxylase-like PLP-dependent enzyme